MYLGAVQIRMPDGSIETAAENDVQRIADLVLGKNGLPIRPDGLPYSVTQAFGGELWDGCPIQVATEEASSHSVNSWVPSQIEVLKAAGMYPTCLVPGSPNYTAFFGTDAVVPNSGTGTRQGGQIVIVETNAPPALLTTGVSTPSIVPQPGGGAFYVPAEETPEPMLASVAPEGDGSWWPWILAALFILPKVAGGGYVAHRYYKRRKAAR